MKHVFPIEELKVQKEHLLNNLELIKEFTIKLEEKIYYSKTAKNIKIAEQWANSILNSKDIKIELKKLHKEVLEYMLCGKPTRYLNEQLLYEIKNFKYENN